MKKLISFLFALVPESHLKQRLRCRLYNKIQKDFVMGYQQGIFSVQFKGVGLKFTENPFHVLVRDKDYADRYTLQQGDTVIDGGSFWGTYAIISSVNVGANGKVIALEPDDETHKKLLRNIALNNISNITVIKKGLWSEETDLSFDAGKELGSTFIVNNEKSSANNKLPVTTIDKIVDDNGVKGRLFIKMNIEGSEIEAIKGAEKTIEMYKPHFAIRTNHFVNGKFTDKAVEELLRKKNYKVESVEMVELTTYGEPDL